MSPTSPEEYKKQRNDWMGWFWGINIVGAVIITATEASGAPVSFGIKFAAYCVGSIANVVTIYYWAKYKGQSGAWGIWGLFWVPGFLIAAIALASMPVKSLDNEGIVPPLQSNPPSKGKISPLAAQSSQTTSTKNIPSDRKEETDELDKRIILLEKYAALREKGLITEEEYTQQKKKILGI